MKYKFQFETGCIYDGSTEVQVRDFIAEFEGKINPSLTLTIEANGGQLIVEEPTNPKAKKRKVKPVKWPTDKVGE